MLLPAAWTKGTVKPVESVAVTAAAVEPLRKSRRDAEDDTAGIVSAGLVG